MHFVHHIERNLSATIDLVNTFTPGYIGGREVVLPEGGRAVVKGVAACVSAHGYSGRTTPANAKALLPWVQRARVVIEALDADDLPTAAAEVNAMLLDSGARPQLNPDDRDGFRLHFHGPDDTFVRGWAAGIATCLAMAIGGDPARRLGVCQAPSCDRVWVDFSRNSHRRFCSERCQSRVKAAAHRARKAG